MAKIYQNCGSCHKKGVSISDSNAQKQTTTIRCRYCDAQKTYNDAMLDGSIFVTPGVLSKLAARINDDWFRYTPPVIEHTISRYQALSAIHSARGDLDTLMSKFPKDEDVRDYTSQVQDSLRTVEIFLNQEGK